MQAEKKSRALDAADRKQASLFKKYPPTLPDFRNCPCKGAAPGLLRRSGTLIDDREKTVQPKPQPTLSD